VIRAAATCPQCGQTLPAGAGKWRPFCSERCKLMDLGQWFAGRYSIPADPDPDASSAPPDDPAHKPRQ
jgi:endogenous inhibitor of DNA gyrase (YacG/DUF329 family)